jgi:membrane protease YdiL (CAAX protease family)
MQDVSHKSGSADGGEGGRLGGSPSYGLAGRLALVAAIAALPMVWLLGTALGQVTAVANLWLGLLPVHGAGLGAALWVLCRGRTVRTSAERLGLSRPDPSRWCKGVAWTLTVLYPANAALTLVVAGIAGWFGMAPKAAPAMALLMSGGTGALFWVSAMVTMGIVAPIAEEILFRLVFFEAFRASYGELTATALTALLFAVIHQAPFQIPALFVLGIALQRLRSTYGTLWAAIALHAGYNAVSLALFAAFRPFLVAAGQ